MGGNFLIKGEEIMAGTKTGGKKAAAKNLARDPLFYAKIGRKGGQNGTTGGFAANPELARIAGAKGGRISRRRKVTQTVQDKA
jgi:general stress protein YciG